MTGLYWFGRLRTTSVDCGYRVLSGAGFNVIIPGKIQISLWFVVG